MAEYRAYIIGKDGHFENFRAFACGNDSDAIEWAKQLVDGHDVELWQGARQVAKFEHRNKSPG